MDALLYLERKRSWCAQNSEDQRQLGNADSACFWHGRSLSYQDVLDAVRSGVVTPEGIVRLDFPTP